MNFLKGLQELKRKIDAVVSQMETKPSFLPEQTTLNDFSTEIMRLIQSHHPDLPSKQKTLLLAVIDLTEIPIMHPSMQKVAVKTALKDASRNLNDYINQWS